MRLREATLAQLPESVERIGYDRQAPSRTIVHLGVGAFHRAHQAVYTDDANRVGAARWRTIGVSLRGAGVRDQLHDQDGLFTVTSKGRTGIHTQLVGSIDKVLVARENPGAVVEVMASRNTLIVTLTVTEKGYSEAADGGIDVGDPQIASDLTGASPRSIYGFIERALRIRRDAGTGGLTFLSCDNLSRNSAKLRALLLDFLDRRDRDLAKWCGHDCQFPSSMVDRIVPATTAADLADLEQMTGIVDSGAVFTEPFRQWVIEDKFGGPRPFWEAGGAQFVADITPYETAKLRMLNGAHSALAYLGLSKGYSLVCDTMADPEIGMLVQRLMIEEASTSFTAAPEQDLRAYAKNLEARFANPALPHRLAQIATDGSQKIAQRWLPVLAAHGEQDVECSATLRALAAWMRHTRGDHGRIDDPRSEQFAALWNREGSGSIVRALFGRGGIYASQWRASATAIAQLEELVTD